MQAIPALFTGLQGVSTALTVAGGLYQMSAESKAANYRAQVAQNNALIAEENAKRATFEGQLAAQEGDVEARAELGYLLSEAGASGLGLESGSIVGRRQSVRELAAKDRGYTRNMADAEAARYRQQGADFESQAAAERVSGKNSLVSGMLGIGSSLVSGAAKVNAATARSITGGSVGTTTRVSAYRPARTRTPVRTRASGVNRAY